jgi:hypothetical protein
VPTKKYNKIKYIYNFSGVGFVTLRRRHSGHVCQAAESAFIFMSLCNDVVRRARDFLRPIAAACRQHGVENLDPGLLPAAHAHGLPV